MSKFRFNTKWVYKNAKYLFLCLLIFLAACKCPNYLPPKILANTSSPDSGSTLILTTPLQPHTRYYWGGPQGTYYGNTWIIDTVNISASGDYSLQYVYSRRKKCKSVKSTQLIKVVQCPIKSPPEILCNTNMVHIDSTLILTAQSIKGTTIEWTGPDTSFVGNPWIREKTTMKMSGSYSAKYVYPGIANCESKQSSKQVYIVNRFVETKLNNKIYYLDIVTNQKTADVFLRVDKVLNNPGADLKVMSFEIKNVSVKEAKQLICRNIEHLGRSKFLTGCLIGAGAVGCALGSVATEGAMIPFCQGTLLMAGPAITECVLGLAGEIASALGKDTEWLDTQTVMAIGEGSSMGLFEALVQWGCWDNLGRVPILGPDGKVVPKPHPTPNQPGHRGDRPGREPNQAVGRQRENPREAPQRERQQERVRERVRETHDRVRPPTKAVELQAIVDKQMSYIFSVLDSAYALSTTNKDSVRITSEQDALFYAEEILKKKFSNEIVMSQRPFSIMFLYDYWVILGDKKTNTEKQLLIIIDSHNGAVIKMIQI